jgi:hypothetical protein
MARKTYPETPAQEAARINAASGDPTGITAEQVANNRKLNESLTASFGFGNSTGGPPINPFASLVAGVSAGIQKTQELSESKLPSVSEFSKADLDDKISKASGELGSGLNGFTGNVKTGSSSLQASLGAAGAAASSGLGGLKDVSTGLGGFAEGAASKFSGAVDSLRSAAGSTSNIAADISGTLNKLTGGSLAGGLQKLAGQVSSAAGMLNNILSLKRAANLPKGAEAFIKQGSAIQLQASSKNDWRVRITCQWDIFDSPLFKRLQDTGGVVWPYLPNITVSTKADYSALTTVHSNYTNYAYKGSQVDDITISGDFSCETETDAAYWIAATTFFKTATKMFFGQGNLAGNPPLICNLTGYGSSIFDKVPIIIKSFSVDLKDDVNYVKCNTYGTNTWVPVMSTISVVVSPVYNRERMRKFNLQDYARGKTADANGVGYI